MPADNRPATVTTADVMLHNGRIATQDERRSFAQAAAVKDGKFVAVGSDQDVMKLRGDRTQVIDVQGRTVIPGLNDSHLHIIRGGLNYNMELRWDGVPSLADALPVSPGVGQYDLHHGVVGFLPGPIPLEL